MAARLKRAARPPSNGDSDNNNGPILQIAIRLELGLESVTLLLGGGGGELSEGGARLGIKRTGGSFVAALPSRKLRRLTASAGLRGRPI